MKTQLKIQQNLLFKTIIEKKRDRSNAARRFHVIPLAKALTSNYSSE